jgi:lipopolysaccharide transport system permease protein
MLGVVWGFLLPLGTLAVYTFLFSTIFQARWGAASSSTSETALLVFSGLLLYSVLAEVIARAPTLVQENVSYVKKVVFPLEILPWLAVLTSLRTFFMGLSMLLVGMLAFKGLPPPTAPLILLILIPIVLFTLGAAWFLASLGVFLRDIREVIAIGTTALLFLSPILYSPSAFPQDYRWIMTANPFTPILEMSKDVLFWGRLPNWDELALLTLGAWGVAWVGLFWFKRTQKAFADVL